MVLRALILVGGYGTRLRPLTFSKPKPLCEFVNKPIVLHQIEALVSVGVRIIILAVSYKARILEDELNHLAKKLNIEIHFSLEKEPMGTAGPIKLNEELLNINDKDPFFMLNADVIADYNFKSLLEFHQKHGHEGSIYVTPVKDPSRYGVVVSDDNNKVYQFVEKPKEAKFGNMINAGLYIFNKDIIKRVKLQPTSIEREIFPAMVRDKQLYNKVLDGYWMDVGKPCDFILGQKLFLQSLLYKKDDRIFNPTKRNKKLNVIPPVVIHDTSLDGISLSAEIGPNVCIGPNVTIGNNVRVKNSCIFGGCKLNDGCFVNDSIIGWKSNIGKWSRLQKLCVLGEDVTIKKEVALVGNIVCPHKTVKEDCFKEGNIIL